MDRRQSFWERLFGSTEFSSLSQQQRKVLPYIVERLDRNDTHLREVLRDDYVRRNLTEDEIRQLVRNPEFVHAARARFNEHSPGDDLGP